MLTDTDTDGEHHARGARSSFCFGRHVSNTSGGRGFDRAFGGGSDVQLVALGLCFGLALEQPVRVHVVATGVELHRLGLPFRVRGVPCPADEKGLVVSVDFSEVQHVVHSRSTSGDGRFDQSPVLTHGVATRWRQLIAAGGG